MSDCGCEKAKAELEEYLRHELCSEDAADIRAHLEQCPGCADEAHVSAVLTEAVQRACKETAPETLRAEILLKLREFQSSEH